MLRIDPHLRAREAIARNPVLLTHPVAVKLRSSHFQILHHQRRNVLTETVHESPRPMLPSELRGGTKTRHPFPHRSFLPYALFVPCLSSS